MKIINMAGTSDETCDCGPWIDHWEKHSGVKATVCGIMGCENKDVVGAHVMKIGGDDTDIYIYPICAACNQSSDSMEAWDDYEFIPADACRQ